MKKIAITTTSFCEYDKNPLSLLIKHGLEIVINPYKRKLNREEVVELSKDAVGIIAGTEPLNAYVLERLTGVKVISRCGVGMDNVDMDVAKRLGIKVYNTPDAPTLAVAELTVGLMLNLLRKVSQMDRDIRLGSWRKKMGNLLYKKNVGILGFGHIGKKVSELLKPFTCNIAYVDPAVENDFGGFKRLSITEMLEWADIVSIHVSSRNKIIGHEEFRLFKKGAWLINVSRGEVVDEECLYECLQDGTLSGAALDVFESEPYDGTLKKLDNVILTSHIGSYAKESRVEMEMQSAINLLQGLELQ
ncbi:D-isomer specific 2-hydroxyacid dehydrogenase NAD-binding protein [Candidatus Magnetobacterium bavaricum]|uniref:D-isomer specific 2-hydroxyacid dehydrogenase NAD-binding protein n=1 Tax=Candidatus Magnetobacterium bavaricum TaxID=29290 RepID=A0A0F3GHB3_9BACT|nr:D-isomer specific 2-hydroxyacid dehydrogenase NAD-binding protein [Candidatus Magnetobacterium bavaricum]